MSSAKLDYDDFSDLIPRLKVGYAYRFFVNENNRNNAVYHIRGIVDDQVVFAVFSQSEKGWRYRVEWIGFFRGWMDESGWLTEIGASDISLPEEYPAYQG